MDTHIHYRTPRSSLSSSYWIQRSIIMLLLLVGGLTTQNIFAQKQISVSLHNVSIKEALQVITEQTDMGYIYNGKRLSETKNIILNEKKQDLNKILQSITNQTGYQFSVEGNTILVNDGLSEKQNNERQKRSIKGSIVDSEGEPIAGANIHGKGSSFGTISLEDGTFIFDLPKQVDTIIISFIGFEKQEIAVGTKKIFDIILKQDVKLLQDVVAVGYQVVERRDMVGAYTQIKASEIENVAYSSVDNMLQGQVAGMIVSNASAQVTAKPSIKIRGTSTILGNTDPLWVVDGIIQPDFVDLDLSSELGDLNNIIGSQVSWLNPNDIETITVLKDASATAIYGSKASNGVIVITTKKGEEGKLNLNYSTSASFRTAPNYGMFNMMNSKERVAISMDAYNQGMLYNTVPLKQMYTYEGLMRLYLEKEITRDNFKEQLQFLETVNTNWFDHLTQNSLSSSHNLSLSGGTKKVTYRGSLSYTNNKGIEIGDQAKRYTGSLKLDVSPNDKLNMSFNIGISSNINYGFGQGVNPYQYALNTSRALPLYDQEGNDLFYKRRSFYKYNANARETGLDFNILHERDNGHRMVRESRVSSSININWKFTDLLKYEFVAGYTLNNQRMEIFSGEKTFYVADNYRGYNYGEFFPGSPEYKAAILPHGGILQPTSGDHSSYNFQNKLIFAYEPNHNHRINAMLGQELRSSVFFSEGNSVWGYLPERGQIIIRPTRPDEFEPLNSSGSSYSGFGILDLLYEKRWKRNEQVNNYLSLFATFAYTFKNRYTLNANLRTDDSNRFGQDVNRRFDPTFSLGLAWAMDQEHFFKDNISWLTQAKWRFSYGVQGNVVTNQSPEMHTTQGIFDPVYGQYLTTITQLPNPFLKWERTNSWNIGLDLQLFNFFTTTLEYYGRKSVVIAQQDLPQYNGIDVLSVNGAEVINQGIEYTISFSPIKRKNLYWTVSINGGKNFNEALFSYVPENRPIADYLSGNSAFVLKKGYDLSSFWSFDFSGLNPQTGYPEFNRLTIQIDSEGYPTYATTVGVDDSGNPIIQWNRCLDYDGNEIKDYEVNAQGQITVPDMDPTQQLVYSGKSEPDFSGGLSTTLRYKNLVLSSHFSAQLGRKIRLSNPYSSMNTGKLPDPYLNLDKELNNRWRQPGDEATTNIPALPTLGASYVKLPSGNPSMLIYDMWGHSNTRLVNGNFLRCTKLSLQWNLPKHIYKKAHMKSMSLRASVANLFVIADKDLQGFDPELSPRAVLPKVYSFSLNVGF